MPELPSLLSRFATSTLCRGLTESEVESLFALCEVRRFAAGTTVFVEGQPPGNYGGLPLRSGCDDSALTRFPVLDELA